jgi:hypothetical protein
VNGENAKNPEIIEVAQHPEFFMQSPNECCRKQYFYLKKAFLTSTIMPAIHIFKSDKPV